jgi:hypothetical protein
LHKYINVAGIVRRAGVDNVFIDACKRVWSAKLIANYRDLYIVKPHNSKTVIWKQILEILPVFSRQLTAHVRGRQPRCSRDWVHKLHLFRRPDAMREDKFSPSLRRPCIECRQETDQTPPQFSFHGCGYVRIDFKVVVEDDL